MKVKLNEEGAVILSAEGLPIWIKEEEDGTYKELAYDVPKLVNDLSRVNNESAGRRKKIEELENKFKPYEGFDLEAARKALDLVKTYDEKQLIDAGKKEEVIKAVEETYKKQLADQQRDLASKIEEREILIRKKTDQINTLLVKGIFSSSKFLTEKTNLHPDVAFSHFGKNFKVEEVEGMPMPVAYYSDGSLVYSDKRPGHTPDTEEALELLISNCPYKDTLLKGSGGSGTGAVPPGGSPEEAPKSMAESLYGKTMKK